MTWWIWLVLAASAWTTGWLIWFSGEDKHYESDVLFGLTFGVIFWPLLAVARTISRRSRAWYR